MAWMVCRDKLVVWVSKASQEILVQGSQDSQEKEEEMV